MPNKIMAIIRTLLQLRKRSRPIAEERSCKTPHLNLQMYESLFQQTPDAIHIVDTELKVMKVNQAFERIYGWKSEEIVGNELPYIPNHLMERHSEYFDRSRWGEELNAFETVRMHKNGRLIDISMTVTAIRNSKGEVIAYSGISRDISEKKRMEKTLREEEDRSRLIAENMMDMIVIVDADAIIHYVSPSCGPITGVKPEELIGCNAFDCVLEEDREMVERAFAEVVRKHAVHHENEVRIRRKKLSRDESCDIAKEDEIALLETRAVPIMGDDGQLDKVMIIFRDITHRERIERELKNSERMYRNLLNWSPVPIAVIQDDIMQYVNPEALKLVGANSPQQVIGKPIMNFLLTDPDLPDNFLEEDGLKHEIRYGELKVVRLDGTMLDVELAVIWITHNKRPAVIVVGRDVTERKKTEELLHKSDKLAVLGHLAAGVAHEIRNPLTSLKGFTQILREKRPEYMHYYTIMLNELDRINQIVGEFLMIAKPQVETFQTQSLRYILRQIVSLIEAQAMMAGVQISLGFEDDSPIDIVCDENKLKQVFINILKNALEATPKGEVVHIHVCAEQDGWVTIQFIDRGNGIPEERIPRLGEPFYTTKEKGTGLGLMVSFKIIEAHRGFIQIKSKLGQGTVAEVRLPISHQHTNS